MLASKQKHCRQNSEARKGGAFKLQEGLRVVSFQTDLVAISSTDDAAEPEQLVPLELSVLQRYCSRNTSSFVEKQAKQVATAATRRSG
jgi:hypothetical protein